MFKKQITKLARVKKLLIYTKAHLRYIYILILSWPEHIFGDLNFKVSQKMF